MAKRRKILAGFEIDSLTNSIRNRISGDSFETEVSVAVDADMKNLSKKMDGRLTGK